MECSGEDDLDETGGQVSNISQQVDGSSDAEKSPILVSCFFIYICYIYIYISFSF